MNMIFFQNFAEENFELKAFKKARSYMTWPMEDRVKLQKISHHHNTKALAIN
jgi:hypothetical protein